MNIHHLEMSLGRAYCSCGIYFAPSVSSCLSLLGALFCPFFQKLLRWLKNDSFYYYYFPPPHFSWYFTAGAIKNVCWLFFGNSKALNGLNFKILVFVYAYREVKFVSPAIILGAVPAFKPSGISVLVSLEPPFWDKLLLMHLFKFTL